MPLIARQRSRLAVLAVLALVGSLLAVSAVPAVAAKDEPEVSAEADYSACVAAATEDAGFTDTAGNFAEDEINCLAHYMIAQGTGDGMTFSPNDSISRAQMALFMQRAAGVAGIELDDPEDQELGDIGNWTDTIQDAINQVVGAGIMSGHNGMFNPTGSVSRQDMAVILDAFLAEYGVDLEKEPYNLTDDDMDEPFTDVAGVPFAAYNAINRLYELDVASGTGEGTTFDPGTLVSRAQMAAFVTRALAHTNARPAGLAMQAKEDSVAEGEALDIQVSLRSDDHQAMPDESIDIFWSANPGDAFNDDGECVEDEVSPESGACTIGADDDTTDPDGNLDSSIDLNADSGSVTMWAWTGDVDDDFDADETTRASLEVTVTEPATAIKVTDDMKENASALKFGDTIYFTVQVVDENGDPVADKVEVTVSVIESQQGSENSRTHSGPRTTDASGRLVLDYTAPDPDADTKGDQRLLDLDIALMTGSTLEIMDKTTLKVLTNDANDNAPANTAADADVQVTWRDTDPMATKLVLGQAVKYHESSVDGVRNTVTATLVDQYGDPLSKREVNFWSADATNGLGGTQAEPNDDRTTNRNGVATKSYHRESAASEVETISAAFVVDCNDGDTTDCTDDADTDDRVENTNDIVATSVMHYWAVAPAADVSNTEIAVIDTDNNVVIASSSATVVHLIKYRSTDYFFIGTDPANFEEFEKALKDDGQIAADYTTKSVDGADVIDDKKPHRFTFTPA